MAKKTIAEQVRYLLIHGGKTRYRISKETGIDGAALCRIVQGGDCTVNTAQKVFDLFGYEITRKKGRQSNEKAAKK